MQRRILALCSVLAFGLTLSACDKKEDKKDDKKADAKKADAKKDDAKDDKGGEDKKDGEDGGW